MATAKWGKARALQTCEICHGSEQKHSCAGGHIFMHMPSHACPRLRCFTWDWYQGETKMPRPKGGPHGEYRELMLCLTCSTLP